MSRPLRPGGQSLYVAALSAGLAAAAIAGAPRPSQLHAAVDGPRLRWTWNGPDSNTWHYQWHYENGEGVTWGQSTNSAATVPATIGTNWFTVRVVDPSDSNNVSGWTHAGAVVERETFLIAVPLHLVSSNGSLCAGSWQIWTNGAATWPATNSAEFFRWHLATSNAYRLAP